MTTLNESAVSLAWLLRFLNGSESADQSSTDLLQHQWRAVSEAMRADSLSSEIDSDIWLCKSQTIEHGVLRGAWRPPDSLDDFASGTLGLDALERWDARPTKSSRLDDLIADQPSFPAEQFLVRTNLAVQSYRRLNEATAPPAVRPEQKQLIVMFNQIRSWLNIAIGAPLRGIVLTPFNTPEELQMLAQTADQRIRAIAESEDRDPYLERVLLRVYNIRSFQSNQPFSSAPTRSGQSEVWREQWGWLTQDTAADDARTAIEIAAKLLANIVIAAPLNALARASNPRYSTVALCWLRRFILTLRAMTWAEHALQNEWRLVRPADVLCFAYASLRPNWPRPTIALSHRSSTVKPLLFKTRFWNSPLAAIDATFTPQWETNLAMIWGLFAPTRTIVRMKSPAYEQSEWCQRESEMLDYLVDQCDFMRNRYLIDAAESDAKTLDSLLTEASNPAGPWPVPVGLIQPPMLSDVESTLMSAAGAVRLISVVANEQIEVVRATQALIAGSYPDFDCPTNNAGGWRDYVDIFQALPSSTIDAIADGRFMVNDYGDRVEKLRSPEFAKYLVDFGDPRVPALRDHLAAFEWIFVEEESLLEGHGVANFVVDCRHLSQEHWERSPAYTLHRGLTSAPTSIPVWFLQSASERVDRWPIIGDYRPIFTEHFEDQFSWAKILLLPEDWFARYSEKSGLRW
jgi:hypothetical protein